MVAGAEQLGSRTLAGPLLALWALGSMAGGLAFGSRASDRGPERRMVGLLLLVVAGIALLAVASGVVQLAAGMILAGLGIAPAIACLYLLVDRLAPAGTVTEAFTWVTTAFATGFAAGNALGGSLVHGVGTDRAFLVAAGGVAAAALLGRLRRPVLAGAPLRNAGGRRGVGANRMMSYYWHARRDPLPPGTKLSRALVRRVWGFAREFRWQIAAYLFLLALSSLAAVVPALLVRELLNTAIPQHSFSLVNLIGLAAVGVALANAGLALGQRFLSSRIGEGLIYQLRTRLFDHVQRQPLAFFTHTQTGALTSRLNNDVIGAQRALTGTLGSVFSNIISLVTTLVAMFLLNWRITLIAVAVLPAVPAPGPAGGPPAPGHHPRVDAAQRGHDHDHERALQRRRGAAGDAVRAPRPRAGRVLRPRPAGVRDIGIRSALYGQTFFVVLGLVGAVGTAAVYWFGGPAGARGPAAGRRRRRPGRPRHPGLRPPDRPDQRPGGRDDRVRVLRAGLRGARLREPDPRPARGRPPRPPGRAGRVRPRRVPLPDGRGVDHRQPHRRGGGHRGGRRRAGPARRQLHRPARGADRPGRPVRGRQDHHRHAGGPRLRRQRGGRPGRRGRRARPGAGEPPGRDRPGRPGPPPVPRHHPGQPALRQARRDRSRRSRPPAARPGSST